MAIKIKADELAIEIQRTLKDYSAEVAEGLKKETRRVAKKTVARLKSTSPKKSGEYASGWGSVTEFESADEIRIAVRNRKKPQLTHLLENGHAIATGGRVAGIPHIRPADEAAQTELIKGVEDAIK